MRNNTKSSFPLIYIEWYDAIEAQTTWESLDELLKWAKKDDWITKEVGFLLKETDNYILIANRIGGNEHQKEFSGVMKIPSPWVRKRIDLSSYINQE